MIFTVHVSTKSSKTAITDWDGIRLSVRLNARPFENLANIALVVFLAEVFSVPKTSIVIKKGQHSSIKHIDIPVTPKEAQTILAKYEMT